MRASLSRDESFLHDLMQDLNLKEYKTTLRWGGCAERPSNIRRVAPTLQSCDLWKIWVVCSNQALDAIYLIVGTQNQTIFGAKHNMNKLAPESRMTHDHSLDSLHGAVIGMTIETPDRTKENVQMLGE